MNELGIMCLLVYLLVYRSALMIHLYIDLLELMRCSFLNVDSLYTKNRNYSIPGIQVKVRVRHGWSEHHTPMYC